MEKEARQKGRPTKDPSGKKRVRKRIWVAEATWDFLRVGQMVRKKTAGEIIDGLVAAARDGAPEKPEVKFDF